MESKQSDFRASGLHWYLFWLLALLAYLTAVAVAYQWAGPAGYVAVPTAIGYFIVRKGEVRGNLALSYAIFALLLAVLVGGEVVRASDKTEASINGGCLDGNAWAAQLQNADDRKLFCGCTAENMKWPVMRKLAVATLSFREPTAIQDDAALVQMSTEVGNLCAAKIPAR
jgi:hypothetical protein